MIFSELSLAEQDSGLSYDSGRVSLIGDKNGYGTVVSDRGGEYIVRIYCEKPYTFEKELSEAIISLSRSLSKNTINSSKTEYGFVEIKLSKLKLLQENLLLLIDFLDKLTVVINGLGITGTKAVLPPEYEEPVKKKASKDKKRIRLSFDINSIKGFIGALLGAFAVFALAVFVVTPESGSTIASFSFSLTLAPLITALAATAIIFSDYRFLAKKLDAFGVISCPILSVITVILSGYGITLKGVMNNHSVTLSEAFEGFMGYISENKVLANFFGGFVLGGVVLSVLASIIICIFYFNRYPEETEKTEKIIVKDEKKQKNR